MTRTKDSNNRQLPHHDEAEASVLGGIMLRNDALALLDSLEVEDYYNPRHRVVFAAMRNLEAAQTPIDVVTLEREIQKAGRLESIGGVAFLGELTLRCPTVDNIESYAKIVHERRVTRDVMVLLSNMLDEAFHGESEGERLVHDVTTALLSVRTGREHPVLTMATLIAQESQRVIKDMEARARGESVFAGIPTGIRMIDEKVGGHPLATPTLYIARPGNGKTTIGMHLNRAASAAGEDSILATYEDRGESFAQRGLAQETGLSTELLRARRIRQEDLVAVTAGWVAGGKRSESLLVASGMSAEALVRRVRRENLMRVHRRQKPIRQLIVDYVQKMPLPDHTRSVDEGITHVSQVLSTFAVDENAALVMMAQLNRDVEKRDDHRPRLSDIRACVTGDTLVACADGSHVPISRLVGEAPMVLTVNDRQKIVAGVADRVWKVGRRRIFEVVTASGRRMRCTGKHRLMQLNGWARVSDLVPGDRIAIARRLPEPVNTQNWRDEVVAFAGQMIGDGSYLLSQPMRYTTMSEENAAAVTAGALALGNVVKRYAGRRSWFQLLISGNGNGRALEKRGAGLWLRQQGIFNQRSHQKRIPESAYRMGNAQVACLLRHLWATDGTIGSGRSWAPRAAYSTNSPGLAADVSGLLLRMGVVARTAVVPQGAYKPAHSVVVAGVDPLRIFCDRVGSYGPRRPQMERLSGDIMGVISNTNSDTIPREVLAAVRTKMKANGVTVRAMAAARGRTGHLSSFSPSRSYLSEHAEILDDNRLRDISASDLYWDEIRSVVCVGDEDVYDLTVPGTSNWIANYSIISHNSGSLEQDGKTIFALYCPHKYEPTKKDPATGEVWRPEDLLVICLKNAQGESGFDIKLWWDLKSHQLHDSQIALGGASNARAAESKRAALPAQASINRFDDVPPPMPDGDWHRNR